MIRLDSRNPTGDFWRFPSITSPNLDIHKVIPSTADDRISASQSHIKYIDLVKSADGNDISIYLHSEPGNIPAQNGYSLERVETSIDTGKVLKPYILTNVNGHFYLPIQSESLLDDLVEFMQKIAGYVGIRVILYDEQPSIGKLVGETNRRLKKIRSPVTKNVTRYVDGKEIVETEEEDHPEKDGEFDIMGDDMIKKTLEYHSLRYYVLSL